MTARLHGIRAITFDFGNTLVPVDRATLATVVRRTAEGLAGTLGIADLEAFLRVWGEEQARQFREEVPYLREVDLEQRLVRVLARMRGMPDPGPDERWDDAAASALSTPDEVAGGVDAYSRTFVDLVAAAPEAFGVLERLHARGFRLGILSNWPLAVTIDRFAARAGWLPFLSAIVVSQRVGTIKPNPAIFAVAAELLGATPVELLHVGDDWAQDVVGARRAGWRVAYLRDSQRDSPLPTSEPGADVKADVVLERLADLEGSLA